MAEMITFRKTEYFCYINTNETVHLPVDEVTGEPVYKLGSGWKLVPEYSSGYGRPEQDHIFNAVSDALGDMDQYYDFEMDVVSRRNTEEFGSFVIIYAITDEDESGEYGYVRIPIFVFSTSISPEDKNFEQRVKALANKYGC